MAAKASDGPATDPMPMRPAPINGAIRSEDIQLGEPDNLRDRRKPTVAIHQNA